LFVKLDFPFTSGDLPVLCIGDFLVDPDRGSGQKIRLNKNVLNVWSKSLFIHNLFKIRRYLPMRMQDT